MSKILVIDDDNDFINMIRLLLGLNNFMVETAGSGEEGLKKLEEAPCDLVLLDVMMPGLSGFDVCKQIKGNPDMAETPVVLLTAKAEKEDVIEGISCGANDYVTKPFESEILIAKIRNLLRFKELQDELKNKNKLLESLAITDGLTGAYNHRYFYQKLNEEFARARRYNSHLSCVMMDLDFFKSVNDRYGHVVGDCVLTELAKLVADNIRTHDIFARYGGEEFILLLPQTNETGALNEAERIRRAVETTHFPGVDMSDKVTISLGICTYPLPQILRAEDMVKFADRALYEAKRKGRNKIELYEHIAENTEGRRQ